MSTSNRKKPMTEERKKAREERMAKERAILQEIAGPIKKVKNMYKQRI